MYAFRKRKLWSYHRRLTGGSCIQKVQKGQEACGVRVLGGVLHSRSRGGGTRSYDGGRGGDASATVAGGRREVEKAVVKAANGLQPRRHLLRMRRSLGNPKPHCRLLLHETLLTSKVT
ncbi:hypothetical protein BHM03_00058399 [Ensete ventricosum]|nr:hypothetical protein BHM03_00058399 [Ensete ventricosum]